MTNKEKIIYFLTENKKMTQGELAIALYGDRKKMPYLYSALMELVDGGYVTRTGEHPAYYTLSGTEIVFPEKKEY